MSLNEAPSGVRTHIAFFGCTNVGKSSLVNAFTNQDLALVSDTAGTTTDPVRKAMEILPLGPVVVIDTPGFDDPTELGAERIKRAEDVLVKADIAVLVVDASRGMNLVDDALVTKFKERNIPYVIVNNKSDLIQSRDEGKTYTNAVTGEGVNELREKIAHLTTNKVNPLVADLINPGDIVVLVIPIDSAAPKGRIILPQQQVLRDVLDIGAIPVCCRELELEKTLASLSSKPKLVITDSQAFKYVSSRVPTDILLTSFSILMARMKGNLFPSISGAKCLSDIKDEDIILISEGCTHHRQCEDIGTVKIPNMIRKFTGNNPNFEFTSGGEFPKDLRKYKLIIHCGACTLTGREASGRYQRSLEQGVPITNYGIAIAYMNGILDRSIEIFNS